MSLKFLYFYFGGFPHQKLCYLSKGKNNPIDWKNKYVSQICYKTGKVHLSSVILTYVQSYKKTGHKSVQVKPPI